MTADALAWLLERDAANPGVRYFALRDLLDRPDDDAEVVEARRAIMATGPVPLILAAQHPEGYWEKPGPGYATKYRGTTWQLLFLAELGADGSDPRVRRTCEYVLSHTLSESGGFGFSGSATALRPPPSSVVHCLHGNLLRALLVLGWADDERVGRAIDWQAAAITGDNPAFRYYKSTTSARGFACGVNLGQPCAWGANKALRGLLALPVERRNASIERALRVGGDFLLSRDPAAADYPYTVRVSSTWFRFGFPLSYWSDVLETVEVLVALGHGADGRLDGAFATIRDKADAAGRWRLENTLNGKTWADIEVKSRPSKWVTLRALRVLRRAGRDAAAGSG